MSERKNKPGQGRKSPIKSDQPLQRISTRISVEAIAILDQQDNKAAFIDEAIKEKAKICIHQFIICDINGREIKPDSVPVYYYAKCRFCGYTNS